MATYVELKGYKHGEIGNGRKKKDHNGLSTLDEIAKDLNMSTSNLKRALRIERNLTDSMKELLDSGETTKISHEYICIIAQILYNNSVKEDGDMSVTATELKKNLGKYLLLSAQEDIYITKNGKVVAKLTNPHQNRVETAKELFGILPKDADIDVARDERLANE